MNSNIVGFLCTALTFAVALHLKPQNEPTAVDDPNEFVVSFKSKCLNETTNGTVPMDRFQEFMCIQTNNFSFSTPNITNPNDPSDIYDEVAIFFKIDNDSTCLDNAEIDFECIVYSAYSPKLFEFGLDLSTRASHTTTGLPGKEQGLGEAINLDLLNNKQPYLTKNDNTFRYYPIDNSDDPGVDIYMIDFDLNANHLEFQGIKDQIEVKGTGEQGSIHGTQVLSVMIGKNRGVLRGWPGKSKKVYIHLATSIGEVIKGLDLWTKSPNKYLQQKPPRPAVINLSGGMWRNLLFESHRNDIKHLSTAIKRATDLGAIVVAAAGQDSNFPNGINLCQDTPEVREIKGKWRFYPQSWGNDHKKDPPIITVAAFSYVAKDVQPRKSTFYGESCVDLWAMGESVILPSNGNTAYKIVHGTSYASPVIASLAAIELARDSTLKGKTDAMVKRLKQCGRGFWIKPSTPAAKVKCPQPDSCWAASYICEKEKTCKMDVALMVDVSTKMTSKECKRQQLEVAETLGGFRGEETITEGGLTYPLVRVSYIEFGESATPFTQMIDDPINQHQPFDPVDALQTLCNNIRDSTTCDESIERKPIGLFDWSTWQGLFTTVLEEFETSDALKRAKNMIMFRNHVPLHGTIPRPKRRLLDDGDPSACDNDDVNVVLVNNRANATSMVNDSYLMCLVEYDDDRIMWNNVSEEHFPLIDAISEQLTCINDIPTSDPTVDPTIDPTFDPTRDPTIDPTRNPTGWTLDTTTSTSPTSDPTLNPSRYPTTNNPTSDPTIYPSRDPTTFPSDDPSTNHPTSIPTTYPTTYPTSDPSTNPTSDPTTYPTRDPSTNPTSDPTTKATSTSTLTCHDIGFDLRKGKTPLPHDCKCQSECGGRYCNSFVWITQRLNYAFDIDDEELLCDGFPDSMCCCSCPNCYGFIRLS